MDVLSSRTIIRSPDRSRAQHFYRDVLGLAVYREFGDPEDPGLVFFLGNGLLEISGAGESCPSSVTLWLQVRSIQTVHQQLLQLGVPIIRPPTLESWGLVEMWIDDPDGTRIIVVEVPADHPLRRDSR